ncbi:hypothetical protein DPMN_012840 [Dreissena polymorpha]|uniref:Uncharacterized protein n=1 Tax=Dreissena polymorpha TaxID=45954 RepID=A0A9D4N469_DREPO|nr:hypothetical protein DPMN_012840 [Dreissena polymorpha]
MAVEGIQEPTKRRLHAEMRWRLKEYRTLLTQAIRRDEMVIEGIQEPTKHRLYAEMRW